MSRPRNSLAPTGFFGLRTPMLPVADWLAWNQGLAAPSACRAASAAALDSALAHDRQLLRDRLRQWLARPLVREAIFLASPGFEARIGQWLAVPGDTHDERLLIALVRYLTRMATRPTPFGLFAAHSYGRVGDKTVLALAARDGCQRRTRLDMEYLAALAAWLEGDAATRPLLRYRPNNSLYAAGDQYRYVEWQPDGKSRRYHLVAVDKSTALAAVLVRAEHGATVAELAATLIGPDVPMADAVGFIGALVDCRLLVSDLEPVLTGGEAIEDWLAKSDRGGALGAAVATLAHVRQALRAIDTAGSVEPIDRYRAVAAALATLPARLDESHLFQVDVVRPAPAARLGKAVADDLGRAIEILHRIGEPGQGWLTDFVKAFEQRYGDREVSLFEALDEELGVGFGGGKSLRAEAERLIADLPFPATEDAAEQTWSQRDRYLLGKCAACWTEGSLVLELAEADLKRLAARSPRPLPDAVTVLCSLFGDQSAIDSGDYRLLVDSVVGPSGAQLLGRFCHADAELQAALAGHLRQEEALRPEAVYAEIVCQPEDRVGNILSRPLLRDYEIPYLGRSGAPTDAQIPVADLRIAVRAGRIVLRSVRLGREVLPRLANAHNISHPRNPGVYRFLAALQSQGVMGALWWNWGPLDAAPLLPRVTVGRVVLARARWLATSDELQAIDKCRGAARYRSFQAWRERRRLPRHALLVEDDHELLLDFDNIYCIDSLLARSEHTVVLAEWLAAAGQFAAHGPEGAYCHELVVPFVARARPPAPVGVAQPGNAAEVPRGERCFVPGSEWLYVKLYGGSASADHLLYRLVLPFGRRQVADGRALRWFFIRYADPAPHLRWRLQVPPGGLATVLAQLHAETEPWLAAGHLHRIELGTYEREVERYGGLLGSKLAEELFCADSVAVAEIVAAYHGDRGQDARWRLALLGLDRLLADFALDREARLRLLTLLRDQFAREFKADSHLRQRIGVRLRNERMSLLRLIDEGPAPDDALHAGGLALQRRSTLLVPLARRIAAPGALGALTVPDVLPSYLHMFVNRIFRSAQRAQEYVLYDLLAALYRTPARKDRPDA